MKRGPAPLVLASLIQGKESRHHFTEDEEVKVVTWDPTWEPEEMTIHADFEQKVQEY